MSIELQRERLERELKSAIEDFCDDINDNEFLIKHFGVNKKFVSVDEIEEYIDFDEVIEEMLNEDDVDYSDEAEIFLAQTYLDKKGNICDFTIDNFATNETVISCESYAEYLKEKQN